MTNSLVVGMLLFFALPQTILLIVHVLHTHFTGVTALLPKTGAIFLCAFQQHQFYCLLEAHNPGVLCSLVTSGL